MLKKYNKSRILTKKYKRSKLRRKSKMLKKSCNPIISKRYSYKIISIMQKYRTSKTLLKLKLTLLLK